jgi:hypothetical protein
MPDPIAQVQNAVTAPLSFAKRNPIGFAVMLGVGLLVLLHFSGAINRWIAGRASKGSATWVKVGKWTGAIVAAVCFLSLCRDAMAGTHGLTTIGTGLLSMASAFAFPQPDYVALKDETGNYTAKLTPGTDTVERKFILSAPRETMNGFPYKITDVEFAAKMVMENGGASTGQTCYWDELFRTIAGIDIISPRFGTITDKNNYTGPVAKFMGEYIGNGYAFSGDEAFAAIIPSYTGVDATVTLFVTYPFMHRALAKPDETAIFAGWLQQTQLNFSLNVATAIAAASTGSTIAGVDVELRCGYRQFLSIAHGDPRQQFVVPPLVYRRVLRTPANGQFDVVFPQVSATGPQNTNVRNGERLVAAVLLSDNLGLPGPGTFENVTEIGCQGLGILNTYNVDQFVKAKLPVERRPYSCKYDGAATVAVNLGWPYTTEVLADRGLPLRAELLGIPIALPSAQQKISKLPRVKGDITIHALQASPPNGSGKQYALYLETLRDIDGGYAAQLLAAAGIAGQVTRHVNHDADAAVASGAVRSAQYTGLPQGTK